MSIFNFFNKKSNVKLPAKKSNEKKFNYDTCTENYFDERIQSLCNKYNEILSNGEKCFNNNCCPNCGCVIDVEINSKLKCKSCNEILIVKTNPFDKNKLTLRMSDEASFEKFKTRYQSTKNANNMTNEFFQFFPEYKNTFYKIKETSPNHSASDIIYNCLNFAEIDQTEKISFVVNNIKKSNGNDDNLIEQLSKIVSNCDYIENMMIRILFYDKKYDEILAYLPIFTYKTITNQMFYYNLRNINDEEMVISFGYHMENHMIELVNKSDYKIEDIKKSYFEQPIEKLVPFPFDKSKLWNDYIEKGLLICNEHIKENNIKKARKSNE